MYYIVLLIGLHIIMGVINKKIRKKSYIQFYAYLDAIKTFVDIVNSTNNYLFIEEHKEQIDLKLYNERVATILKSLPKYNLFVGEIITLTKILRKASKQEKINQDEMFDLNLEITNKLFLVRRKKEYINSVFSPLNLINNFIDIFIYTFYDYEEYFLKPKTEMLKKNLTKAVSYLTLALIIITKILDLANKFLLPN